MEDKSFRTLVKQDHSKIKFIPDRLDENDPLKKDKDLFNIRRVRVKETFDEPFMITVDMVSEKPDIDYRDLIGQGMGIAGQFEDQERYFHGVVISFENLSTPHFKDRAVSRYQMILVPRFWLTKLTTDCKVFQEKSVLDIIKDVFVENDISDFEFNCQQAGKVVRDYCIQYNESDFNFVSRLMEEEGIFYFFRFEKGKHIMVLTDTTDTLKDAEKAEKLVFAMAQQNEYIFNRVYALNPQGKIISKDFTQRDYNMTNASALLENTQMGSPQKAEQFGELYHYSGQFDAEYIPEQSRLEHLTKIRLEAIEAQQSIYVGVTSSPYLGVGTKFELTGHHADDTRNQKYIVKSIEHVLVNDEEAAEFDENYYRNEIHVFEDGRVYRPDKDTPKPRVTSIHSARVTGPEGEEIWTDAYGRIKIQFPWDRLGKKDDKSSCWVRVMQGWGGNDWGVLYTPRVGMEVMVSFIEGDMNRPVVTGCLYNSDHMPPYLPERITGEMMPTKSTYKTNSTKGGGGFNEFRFEDLKGAEQIYMRAEKDDDKYVRENKTLHIESGSLWESVDNGDRDVAIYGDGSGKPKTTPDGQALPAGAGDDFLEITTGNRSVSFLSGNGAILDSLYIKEGDRAEQIDKGNVFRIHKEGDVNAYIDKGNHTELITTGNKNTSLKTGHFGIDVDTGNYGVHVKTGDQVSYTETGNNHTEVKTGNHKTLVGTGDYGIQIKAGNMGMTLDSGNRTTHIKAGDYNLKLDGGNQTETITGDVTETITGDFTSDVNGNYTLTIAGTLDIVVTGAITITSDADISLSAGGAVTIEAGGAINMTSGAETAIESGAAMTLTASQDISAEASMGGVDIKGMSDVSIASDTGAVAITSMMDFTAEASAGNVELSGLELTASGTMSAELSGMDTTVSGDSGVTVSSSSISLGS